MIKICDQYIWEKLIMQCTRITGENADRFGHLCPAEVMNDENTVKLGVIGENGSACSICAVGVSGQAAVIDWIYTDPDKRETGAASFLLENISELVSDMGFDRIEVNFRSDDEELDSFLAGRDFLVGAESRLYRVPLEDIIYGREMDSLNESFTYNGKTRSIMGKDTMESVNEFFDSEGIDMAYLKDISLEYSIVHIEDGNVTGGMFVSELDNGDLHINYLVNDSSPRVLSDIICVFYDVIIEKEKTGSNLVFTDQTGDSISLIEHLTENDREDYEIPGMMYAVKAI